MKNTPEAFMFKFTSLHVKTYLNKILHYKIKQTAKTQVNGQ